jgi:hypothetical protein
VERVETSRQVGRRDLVLIGLALDFLAERSCWSSVLLVNGSAAERALVSLFASHEAGKNLLG